MTFDVFKKKSKCLCFSKYFYFFLIVDHCYEPLSGLVIVKPRFSEKGYKGSYRKGFSRV